MISQVKVEFIYSKHQYMHKYATGTRIRNTQNALWCSERIAKACTTSSYWFSLAFAACLRL